MIDYDAFLERARASRSQRNVPEPEPAPPIKTAKPFKWPDSGLAWQGFACLYGVIHHFNGGRDIFQKGVFTESLRRFNDVFFGIDHRLERKPLGSQDKGTLELADTDVGLAFRLAIQPEHLEILNGRDQVSVAYIPHCVEFRDGVRIIKQANLVEISSVYVGAMTTTHAAIVEKKNARSLAEDAKHGFPSESAATAFIRALKQLQ